MKMHFSTKSVIENGEQKTKYYINQKLVDKSVWDTLKGDYDGKMVDKPDSIIQIPDQEECECPRCGMLKKMVMDFNACKDDKAKFDLLNSILDTFNSESYKDGYISALKYVTSSIKNTVKNLERDFERF